MNWQEPSALAPSAHDEFHGGAAGASYVFRRERQGQVTAVEVFAGRVRNIRFTRTAN